MNSVNHPGQHTDKAYRLSIQTGLNGFSFCVGTAAPYQTTQLALPVAYPVDDRNLSLIEHFFVREPALQDSFGEVAWFVDTPWYSLVPQKFFLPEMATPEMRRHFADSVAGSEIGFDSIEALDAVLVYAYPSGIANLLRQRFGTQLSMHHVASDTLQKLASQSTPETSEPQLHALIRESDLMVAIFQAGKPLFFNRFLRPNPAGADPGQHGGSERHDELSLLYYLLWVLQTQKMDPLEASIRILSSADLPLLKAHLPESSRCRYSKLLLPSPFSMPLPDPFIHLLNLAL